MEETQTKLLPDEFLIREDKVKLILTVVIMTVIIVTGIGLLIDGWGSMPISATIFSIFIAALILAFIVYLIKELYQREVQIIISKEGIYLRGLGHYPWSLIESFSTVKDADGGGETLVLHFDEYADEEFEIGHLEFHKQDIVNIMLACKGSTDVYYAGHYKK